MIKHARIARYQQIRQTTLDICSSIENEDFVVQPNAEVSPPKWHLGHTTWFFETVILKKFNPDYQWFNSAYNQLFNSYYKAAGSHTIQSERGYLSRPTVAEIMRYRTHVDTAISSLLVEITLSDELTTLLETGLHHEQQHQELLLMDIKTILASNLLPTQYTSMPLPSPPKPKNTWADIKGGLVEIGYPETQINDGGFSYDNERPRHQYYLYPFSICQSLVTNGDFLAFMHDNGYSQAQYWLSQGWDWISQRKIQHPLYWVRVDGQWFEYTLHGLLPLEMHQPLVHISYFEADAFAKWKGCRLPTEQELEIYLYSLVSKSTPEVSTYFHPNDANAAEQVWCWTSSQYSAYPRFKAFDGLLNEYNGKFMCNQFVLRGGCVVTPNHHYRNSYRNFYLPHQRWMFSGIRLAKDTV
jgi:ergothioneine biosynthesis protein EgtB